MEAASNQSPNISIMANTNTTELDLLKAVTASGTSGDSLVVSGTVSSSLPVGAATSAKQDTMIAGLQALNSLAPTTYDYIGLSYTGTDLTSVLFKSGGASGTLISTLTLAYSSSVLQSVTKT